MLWRCVCFLPVPCFPLQHIFTALYLVLRIGSECASFDLPTLRSKVVSPATLPCWQRRLCALNLSVQNSHKIWFTSQALTLLTLGKVCQPCGGWRQRLLSSFPLPPSPQQQAKHATVHQPKGPRKETKKQLYSHPESHETRT